MNNRSQTALNLLQAQKKHKKLWLGTWQLGGEGFGFIDQKDAVQVLENAYEYGIKWYDTAHFYAHGKSEALLAKTFSKLRQSVYYATKAGLEWDGNHVKHAGSYSKILESCKRSLETLKTDYLDLLQLHWPDPNIPLEESIEALQHLQKSGLIKQWGVCNLSTTALQMLPATPYCHQVHFNRLHNETLHALQELKQQHPSALNCIYSPFEQGLLTASDIHSYITSLSKRDVRRRNPYFKNPLSSQLKTFHEFAEKHHLNKAELALSWILKHPEVDAIIIGIKTPKQLKEIMHFKYLSNPIFLLQ